MGALYPLHFELWSVADGLLMALSGRRDEPLWCQLLTDAVDKGVESGAER
jgi:hypothetical protein